MSATLAIYARDVMTRNVLTVQDDAPVENAAKMMFENAVSGLPVVDENDLLVGVVTEFDVIAKQGATIGDIMTRDVVTISETSDLESIAQMIIERRIRRLPVTQDRRVVGIISRSDLIRLFALTRWSCESCGYFTRGFERLTSCPECGSQQIVLEREPPGM